MAEFWLPVPLDERQDASREAARPPSMDSEVSPWPAIWKVGGRRSPSRDASGGRRRGIVEARRVFWGGYSGYFIDPEENYWEVAHSPFVTFDEREEA
ncbi:MAG: hypothetical protein R2849_12925 [Thermomicrobiales bacterium]